MKASKYGITVATCVCCSMISEIQPRYGVGSRCQGRSMRPSCSNHASTRDAKVAARAASSGPESALTRPLLHVVEQLERRQPERAYRVTAADRCRHPESGDELRLVSDVGRRFSCLPGGARAALAQFAELRD